MNKPTNQHYNAQMFQDRFTDEEGRLYFYDKRIPEKGVLQSIPKKLFVKRHLYTLYPDSGEKDFSGEEELSRLEGQTNEIIEKIVRAARTGEVPYLISSEKKIFDRFFYFQRKRVPDFLDEKLPDHRLDDDIIEPHKASGGALSLEVQDIKNDPRTMSRIRHNIRAMAAVAPSKSTAVVASDEESLQRSAEVEKESLQRLAETGLLVIHAPNESFIIGSRPILERRLPDESPDSEPSLFLLPLAYDVAVQLYGSRGEVELEIEERSDLMWEINKAIMEQSTVIAGRSRELIASLAGVR